MIVPMDRVRIMGPRRELRALLEALQDLEVVHIDETRSTTALRPAVLGPHELRTQRDLRSVLDDVDTALRLLDDTRTVRTANATEHDIPRLARTARTTRRELERITQRIEELEAERATAVKYQQFFEAFGPLLTKPLSWPDGQLFPVVLRAGVSKSARLELDRALRGTDDDELEIVAKPLPSGELAWLVLASAAAAPRVARLLRESNVDELPPPSGFAEKRFADVIPKLARRIRAIPEQLREETEKKDRIRNQHFAELEKARSALHDRLLLLDACGRTFETERAFVVEGWMPSAAFGRLEDTLEERLGEPIVVELLTREAWKVREAPVVLTNPRLFRPFELLTRMVPLPRYGTIDPTPFVGIFFPMFFGVMLGDVGYGVILAVISLVLFSRSKPGSKLRSVSQIAGACAVFTIVLGFMYGELFGDIGEHVLGLEALAFNREEAVLPFLGLSIALGAVHICLAIVLAVVGAWRSGDKRLALGRGVTLFMLLLSGLALLAAFEVLPDAFFTPAVIAILLAFPILVILEGVVAVIELLSTFGHILSYARIMALGTASLMLAVVANQMAGAIGSVVVGVVFALIFHVVNFAIGLFSPTIHAMRLHYVEFFGKFYSPGGQLYRPFAHWRPGEIRS